MSYRVRMRIGDKRILGHTWCVRRAAREMCTVMPTRRYDALVDYTAALGQLTAISHDSSGF